MREYIETMNDDCIDCPNCSKAYLKRVQRKKYFDVESLSVLKMLVEKVSNKVGAEDKSICDDFKNMLNRQFND